MSGRYAAMIAGMVFCLMGCIGIGHRPDNPLKNQTQPVAAPLTVKESQQLAEWRHAASLADEVEDYQTAIDFYSRIVEYFPDTPDGAAAAARLKALHEQQN